MGIPYPPAVSPSCIPQPACKFRCKYKALADRSARTINPDLPLGATPSGSQFPPPCRIPFSDGSMLPLRSRHTIMAFSQMDVVASLGALLRWNSPRCASVWLWIGKRRTVKHELCTFVGDWDEKDRGLLKRNRSRSARNIFCLSTIANFQNFQIAIVLFRVFRSFCCSLFSSLRVPSLITIKKC